MKLIESYDIFKLYRFRFSDIFFLKSLDRFLSLPVVPVRTHLTLQFGAPFYILDHFILYCDLNQPKVTFMLLLLRKLHMFTVWFTLKELVPTFYLNKSYCCVKSISCVKMVDSVAVIKL